MVNINNGEHDNPHELQKENSEGSLDIIYTDYTHADFTTKLPEKIEKLEYICDVCSRCSASTYIFFHSAHGHQPKGTAVLWRWY